MIIHYDVVLTTCEQLASYLILARVAVGLASWLYNIQKQVVLA
jgi:hypothetical protein